ncbi:MAG: rod shape-determining protein MreC [Clostridia bacterium]|nr:rod shape-determining protein MreC [Clostridia bacterium]
MRLLQSRAFKTLICVIVALVLGAVIAAYTHSHSSPLSSATSTVLEPFQKISAYLSYKFSNFNDNFKSSATLAEENAELKAQIEEYQQKVIDYNDIKRKLNTYEDFLEVKEEHSDYKFCNTSIITRDSSDPYGSFTLNKGSKDGISVKDPVIYGKNLIGVVTSVSPTTCTVNTIASPKVNVGVYDSATNEVGYTSGTGMSKDGTCCKIPGLKKDSQISPNGIICTSGTGGIYPKDLIVGTVLSVNETGDTVSSYATVKPSVDITKLSEVFVIVDFEGQGIITVSGD